MAASSSYKVPYFDGDERNFELWQIKFLGLMRIRGYYDVFNDASDSVDQDKNAHAFAELIQCLDDRSLSLIVRDALDDGRAALNILKGHYLPKGKPRIITLYTELTSLKFGRNESLTDFVIRAETLAAQLRDTGETISDSLLIAMIMKALPDTYTSFVTVINQKDDTLAFCEFKTLLRNYEDTNKLHTEPTNASSIMNMKQYRQESEQQYTKRKATKWCSFCKSRTHETNQCFKRNDRNDPRNNNKAGQFQAQKYSNSRFCTNCNSNTHDTRYCRRNKAYQQSAHMVTDHQDDPSKSNHDFIFKISTEDQHTSSNNFLVDSGATVHIINDKKKFVCFEPSFCPETNVIQLADGTNAQNVARGQGNVNIELFDKHGKGHNVLLKNALYVPSFKQNILSVPLLTKEGASVNFTNNSGILDYNGYIFNIAKRKNLYYVNSASEIQPKIQSNTLSGWHSVLGHCNIRDVLKLEKHVEGMKITGNKDTKFECETCVLGKMCDSRSRNPDRKASAPLELVHLDLAGPVQPTAKDGYKYALICVDDYSNLTLVYFLKQKSDTVHAFKKFLSNMSPYGKVKKVRSDNGGEFISNEFGSVLTENLIYHEKSAPYSPHQNGTAERHWRTLFEMARCLLLESKLPKFMWSYAVMASAYIRNRCINKRIGKTPIEVMTKQKPNISNMHVFGQTCFTLIQNPKKLDPRSEKGIFVGYDKYSPAYLVYFPDIQVVKKVRCVKFTDANSNKNDNAHNENDHDFIIIDNEANIDLNMNENDDKGTVDETVPVPNDLNPHLQDEDETALQKNNQEILINPMSQTTQTENESVNDTGNASHKRKTRKPKYLDDYECNDDDELNAVVHYCYNANFDIPQNYKDAISCNNAKNWKQAMKNELQSLQENDTYDLVPMPKHRQIIGGKWVYTIKSDKDGNETYKARFVAKGYSQIEGIDYHETFSPTTRMSSIRIFAQLALQYDFEINQLDVKSAFLNAPIDCEIYMKQPEGFELTNEKGENLVLKLKKSLYGLKQSGRNWNSILDNHLRNEGYIRSTNDPCVYFKPDNSVLILVWVDDILVASEPSILKSIKRSFEEKFQMKDLGKISYFLGIQFETCKEEITMSQSIYIAKILERFGMQDCKPRYTPCEMKTLDQGDDSEPLNSDELTLYKQIVGALIYIMTATRPDISYTVTRLSQYMSNAETCHLTMAKHTLRYLKGTIDHKLTFRKSAEPLSVTGFCDADWANCEDRKSITGYCFRISENGPVISWKSRKQPTVALSTCEAEYMSLVSAIQEGKYLVSFLNEVSNLDRTHYNLLCDNQGAIALAKNPIKHQRSKHIDIKYHFIRDEITEKRLNVKYIPTENNVADVFTKPVSRMRNQKFKTSLMG